jgi:alkylmercury lyase
VGYEDVRVTAELDGSVQRAAGVSPQRHETLGELVKSIAEERWVQRPENLISEEPTRHDVWLDGQVLHTFCFADALMLPFVLGGEAVDVRSESPSGGEVAAMVTEEGVEGSPRGAVVSFGAARAEGPICETLCAFLNAFPLARRLRVLDQGGTGSRDRRPLDGRSVRPRTGLGLRPWQGIRRRDVLLLSFALFEREELP